MSLFLDTIRYLSLHDNKYIRYYQGHEKKYNLKTALFYQVGSSPKINCI